MKCQSTLTYDFDDAKTASWFASSLQEPQKAAVAKGKARQEEDEIDEEAAGRASVSVKTAGAGGNGGKTVVCTVTARDAAALRARTTTLLRDVKVVLDVLAATPNAKGK